MKTKELIRRLQEEDPTGEEECCVGNCDIFFVEALPAYYDGCNQVLIRDPAKAPYYDIVGGKYTEKGLKISLRTMSIPDAIFENADMPVDFSDLHETRRERYEKVIEEKRKTTREIRNGIEKDHFVEYMAKRLADQTDYAEDFDKDETKEVAGKFFDENMSYLDKMPDHIKNLSTYDEKNKITWGLSWHERREIQWDEQVAVDFENGNLILKKV